MQVDYCIYKKRFPDRILRINAFGTVDELFFPKHLKFL